ncbi:MAG: GNAT family N-acetyltransferase, partial [Acidimicrobiia bacterium]|nr:GNAT family N-acetyltransferase [Acidimicrobiia bacterium]
MTDPDGPPGYPTRWEVDAVLSDGGTVHVRPVRPDDRGRLDRFHRRQSPESIYFRFFGPHPRLSERELDHFTIIDYRDRMALVCLLGDDIVGVGRYEQYSPGTAEVAFFIDDEHHGRGMATLLLEYLMVAAREVGYGAVIATVMPTNQAMLRVFHKAGFQVRSGFSDGVVEVRFDIEPTAETEAAIADRARRAAARSVARLLRPQSIAVIGAGREAGGLGHELFARLIAGWFDGPVYPVNRDADVVRSVRAHRRLVDVADPVDLAFVAVPPEALDEVLDDCGRKGVGALVVLTADVDGEALAVRARRAGMRLVGPASLGVLNHAPDVRMRAIPAGRVPRRGRIALAAASAALGAVVLGEAAERDIGLSSFVSLGGKSDIDTSDLLQFWAEDADTAAIALYLESIPRPRRFFAVARSVSRSKPIVAISMVDDTPGPLGPRWSVFSALLAQAGVIEVASLSQLFDTTRLLASQPLPAGRRLAIVANAHGAATLAAAAARRERLEPEMSTIADDGSVRVQTGDGADTAPATSQAPA